MNLKYRPSWFWQFRQDYEYVVVDEHQLSIIYTLNMCLSDHDLLMCSNREYGVALGDIRRGDVLAILCPPHSLLFIIRKQRETYRMAR